MSKILSLILKTLPIALALILPFGFLILAAVIAHKHLTKGSKMSEKKKSVSNKTAPKLDTDKIDRASAEEIMKELSFNQPEKKEQLPKYNK